MKLKDIRRYLTVCKMFYKFSILIINHDTLCVDCEKNSWHLADHILKLSQHLLGS